METRTSEIARVLAGRVEARLLELPTMPDAAARVLAMCQDGAADAARLSEVIHQDPAIASNVLRVANSAATFSSYSSRVSHRVRFACAHTALSRSLLTNF